MREHRQRYNDSYNDTSNGSDSDDYPVQNGHEPQAKPKRRPFPLAYRTNRWERFDLEPPTLTERELDGRGRLVKFYKNGDKFHTGVPVSVTPKKFKSMVALCDFLSEKIPLTRGIACVFNLESGRRVKEVRDFSNGDVCVVSSTNSYNKDIKYGGNSAKVNMNSTPFTNSAMTVRNRLSRNYDSGSEQNPSRSRTQNDKPVSVTIISNDDRRDRKDVILNPKTAQQFEQFLVDIGSMMSLNYPPATGMFSTRKLDLQIDSFSKLFKEVNANQCNEFIMCGQEQYPRPIASYAEEEEDQGNSSEADYEREPEPEPVQLPVRQKRKEQVGKKGNFQREVKEPPLTSRKPVKSNKEPPVAGKRPPYKAKSPPRKSQRTHDNEEDNPEDNRGYGRPPQKSNRAQARWENQENGDDNDDYSPPRKSNRDRFPAKRDVQEHSDRYDEYNSHRKSQRDENHGTRPHKKEGKHLDNRELYGSPPLDDYSPPRETPPQKAKNHHNQPRNPQRDSNRYQEDDAPPPRKPQAKDKGHPKVTSKPERVENKPRKPEEDKKPERSVAHRDSNHDLDSRYEREPNSSGNENDDDDDSDNRSLSPITPRPRGPRMESPEC